jgi:hypothetical protein
MSAPEIYHPLGEGEEAASADLPPPWGVPYTDTFKLTWAKDACCYTRNY